MPERLYGSSSAATPDRRAGRRRSQSMSRPSPARSRHAHGADEFLHTFLSYRPFPLVAPSSSAAGPCGLVRCWAIAIMDMIRRASSHRDRLANDRTSASKRCPFFQSSRTIQEDKQPMSGDIGRREEKEP